MTSARLSAKDPCSYSEPNDCIVKRIHLDLAIDFDKKEISGTAHLGVEKKRDDVEVLILDSNELSIGWVKEHASQSPLAWNMGENSKPFGAKLEITLPSGAAKDLTVSIQYKTSPSCSALQWLRPEQTAGKRQPYLFSQCQAIHARSLFPCQDTPSVKFTYTADVTAPREITVLMSAVRLGVEACEGEAPSMTHQFEQKVPIPSYLLAIIGGDIESRVVGPRTKVWSERELVDQAAYEFAETEQMLQVATKLMGPYVWGQYDLLVLPPSFPYGGMENPCLTFVTPTLLAGDRSLADVVAHEISHSWTGNLVTNCTFEHFWLNEGYTKYVERAIVSRLKGGEQLRQFLASEGWRTLQATWKIKVLGKLTYLKLTILDGSTVSVVFSTKAEEILRKKKRQKLQQEEQLYTKLNEGHTMFMERKLTSTLHGGEPLRNFLAHEGWKTLQETVKKLTEHNEAPYTKLIPDLVGEDPDDAFSTVPYEKGFALLFHLEGLLGGPDVFEPFVRAYIEKFKYQSIDSQQWKEYLFSYFSSQEDQQKLNTVNWDSWFYAEGMPDIQPHFDLSLAKPCQDLASRWLGASDADLTSFSSTDLQEFSALQRREFVALLLEADSALSVTKLETMEKLYQLSDVRNSEIRFRWLRLGVKGRWQDVIPRALQFVNEQGRMKFVRPIYQDLYKWEEARPLAIDNFRAHCSEMHNTTAKEVAKDLHL